MLDTLRWLVHTYAGGFFATGNRPWLLGGRFLADGTLEGERGISGPGGLDKRHSLSSVIFPSSSSFLLFLHKALHFLGVFFFSLFNSLNCGHRNREYTRRLSLQFPFVLLNFTSRFKLHSYTGQGKTLSSWTCEIGKGRTGEDDDRMEIEKPGCRAERQSLGGFLQLIGRKLGSGIVCLCLLLLFLFAVGTLDSNECIQERRQLKTTGPCLASAGEPTCFASFRTRSRHVGPPAEKLCGWWQGTNAVERWSDGAMDRNGGDGAWTGLQLAHLIGGSLCNPLLGAGRAARCPVLQDRDADGSIWGTQVSQ